jgi:hypothetical protein
MGNLQIVYEIYKDSYYSITADMNDGKIQVID